MTTDSWAAFAVAEPDLAKTVEARFGAFLHHTLATLRKDGSPRTSGTEVTIRGGDLWLGSMPNAMKALDLRRDPRCAIQANLGEGDTMAGGDVRISGRAVGIAADDQESYARYAVEGSPPAGGFDLFRIEITEVVRTAVEGDELVVRHWRPGGELKTVRRK